MARIRTIKPEFWTSEQILECSPLARLVFIGMWNFCDDKGVHPASLKTLKAEVIPSDDITIDQLRCLVGELIRHDLLQEFESGGRNWWFVTGWKHQFINRPTPSRYPSPPADSATDLGADIAEPQERSRRTHGALTEDSRSAHGGLTEDSIQEGKGKEWKGRENITQMDVSCSSQESISVVETHMVDRKNAESAHGPVDRSTIGRGKRDRVCDDDGSIVIEMRTHHRDAGDDPTLARDRCGHVLAATDEICRGTDGHRTGQSGGDHVTDTHRTRESGGDDAPSQADSTPAGNANPGGHGRHDMAPEQPEAKPLAGKKSTRHATDNRRSPGRSAKRTVTEEDFECFWAQRPKRDGADPKSAAFRAWGARIRDGTRPEEMISGVMAYAQHCDRRRITGTPFVMQAATFLGPDLHFRNDWRKPNGTGSYIDPDDEPF